MAWVPIADSGIEFSYSSVSNSGPVPEMSGSVVSVEMANGTAWHIEFPDAQARNIRITVQEYDSQRVQLSEGPSEFEFYIGGDLVSTVPNEILGDTTEFVPNPVNGNGDRVSYLTGAGSELYRNEAYSMLIEVEGETPPEPPSGGCQEHGRTTRAYVSGYTLDRVHVIRAARTQRRCLIANFNGAIGPGRQIVRVKSR